MNTPTGAVRQFVDRINSGDVPGLAALMADDHRFIDATGAVHPGKEKMSAGWVQFFGSFPDYHIELESVLADGSVVAAFGRVTGSFRGEPDKSWRFPAAFRALVHDGLIAEWRVYADIEPMAQSAGMRRFGRASA